ncbi:PREDICTED: uncharacterized protein LOC107067443 isoform X1 [Polistes dominula]|uniref:Uncharacterized protein LOC107067443 isoform X1 n=1 Tax=Polistes dominula TaxID=743375 RepID=A0ABM1IE17_POLDO|nr:PREDICTED: uncharacterized protein LOC107067443 isoform X1 [Polistes dominula]
MRLIKKMKYHLILFFHLCLLTIIEVSTENADCNYHLTAPKGVIKTPNFPKAFPVPIMCRWVIDVSDIPSTNSSIVVYMTQLYVYKGLKLTEYAYYESETTNYGASLIKEITEGNVFEYRWFRTFRPFLVLEFELDRLEGNHVRVLDDLLDVYGFNVTYQMTEEEPNSNACSVSECSFTGNCLLSADYTTFSCECFPRFYGDKCNEGPLCFDDQQNSICLNGGTCKHLGAKAVHCDCLPGYVGQNCEIQLLETMNTECGGESCILQCPYYKEEQRPCACTNGKRIYNNRSRYECRIKLSKTTPLRSTSIAQQGNLESYLTKPLIKHLKSSNISSMEDLEILSMTPSSEITFEFFANSDDGDKIRESLNRLVQRRRLGDLALESTHFTFQQKPAFRLQNLRLDRSNEHEVHLGDEINLHCVAQGSNGIHFIWYKDNMLINVKKANRGIRYEDLPNDGLDMYASILRIDKATTLDGGQYTCQAIDRNVQQCKSLYVQVKNDPDVKVTPMSITVEKGSNIQLTCTTPNMHSTGIGFGWTKNRALLKLEPGSEIWEDLYPDGSILKITNVQKSAIYTCNVAHRSMSVRVELTNRTLVRICPKEISWAEKWPDTAPGSEALIDCPRHFVGPKVSRLCSMRDATTPEWLMPDFSNCLYEPFIRPYNKFRSLTLGYQNTTGSETILALWEVLRSREISLYPNEADGILSILIEIEHYQRRIDPSDLHRSAEALTHIVNHILNDENSILNPQRVWVLLQMVERNLIHWSKKLNQGCFHLSLSSMVVDIQPLQFHSNEGFTHSLEIPTNDDTYPDWYKDTIGIRLWKKRFRDGRSNTTYKGIVIVYKTVSNFLPKVYIKEFDNGTELEYRINSHAITVTVASFKSDKNSKIWLDLEMKQLENHSGPWNVSCGLMDHSGSWNLNDCISSTIPDDLTTHCLCPNTGTVALFLTARIVRMVLPKKEQTTSIVILGCASCLVQCSLTLFFLSVHWWKNRSWLNFLKVQCCGALIGAMALFIYAICGNFSDSNYYLIAIGLEAFLLVGMSTPISEALIIYSQFVHIRPNQHLHMKITVIAVITGVPILAVLATELTRKSTGWRHESWWLIHGSGVYNIFVTCTTMMSCVFAILYLGVIHEARALVEKNLMKKETIKSRTRLLHRAAVVICGIIATETSSIFYINSTSIIYQYIFASLSTILGFIISIAYVSSSDINLLRPILPKLKWKLETSNERISVPIKVCSKIEAEMQNDAIPPPPSSILAEPYIEIRGVAAGSIDTREFTTETSSSVAGRYLPEIRIDRPDDINLENYSTSPRKYQEAFDSAFAKRTSQCLAESYGVSVTDRNAFRDLAIHQNIPSECSAKLLCSADIESRLGAMPDVTLAIKTDVEHLTNVELKAREHVNVIPDIANTTERKQPDGEEKMPEIRITSCETTTSGMLDRISHDLDYLLNRTHTKEEV